VKCPKCGYEPSLEEVKREIEMLKKQFSIALSFVKATGFQLNVEQLISSLNIIIKELKKIQMSSKELKDSS